MFLQSRVLFWRLKNKNHKKFVVLITTLAIFAAFVPSLAIPFICYYTKLAEYDPSIFTFAYIHFNMIIFMLQFVLATLFVRERFRVLNKFLGQLFSEVKLYRLNSSVQDAWHVLEIYHDLCNVVDMINSTLTFPLVFVIFYFFIMNLFATYNNVYTFFNDPEKLFFVCINDGTWVLVNYVLQSVLIHSSYSTTREAEQSAIIIAKLISSNKCSKIHHDVFSSFLVQNQYRSLKFQTPFFTINWKLLLAVSYLKYIAIYFVNISSNIF